MSDAEIIVVGLLPTQPNDVWVLDQLALWLADHGHPELGEMLFDGKYSVYDVSTFPERGDVMDHLAPGVQLVVALHLYGIGKIPGGRDAGGEGYYYDRANGYLLQRCMEIGAMLAAWGDQPWLSRLPFEVVEIKDSLKLYARKQK